MEKIKNISIIGCGTWGIALARLLNKNGHNVKCYSKIEEEINYINQNKNHPKIDIDLNDSIIFTNDLKFSLENSDVIVIATPSIYVRQTVLDIKPYYKNQVVVCVSKGIEKNSHLTMSQIIEEVLEINDSVCLSGPTHAEEVCKDLNTAIVSSSKSQENSELIQNLFMNENFRVYTNSDIIGVEICGALKNIIALACGISSGLGHGDNAKAALITRGIYEMSKIGKALNLEQSTFYGLAGIGDLIVTGTSIHSRNNKAGYLIGQGYKAFEACQKVNMVVEGINALPAAIEIKNKYNLDLPIIEAVNDIVNNDKNVKEVVRQLMNRDKKSEN